MYPSTHPPRQDSHLHRRNPVPLTRPHHSPCSPPHAARLRAKGGKRRRRRDPARSQTAASPPPPPASPQRRPAITPPAHVTHLQPPRPPGRGLRRPLAAAAAPRGDRPPHTHRVETPPPCPPARLGLGTDSGHGPSSCGPGSATQSAPLVLTAEKRAFWGDTRHTGGVSVWGLCGTFPAFLPFS